MSQKDDNSQFDRRSVLKAAGTGLALGVTGVGSVSARGGKDKDKRGNKGYPPNGITKWGEPSTLGDGEVRTFTVETPSGKIKNHGIYMDKEALNGLPTPEELLSEDKYDDVYGEHGEGTSIHRKTSQQFFLPLPDSDDSPFTFVSFNWNPNGHPMKGVWTVPHFDMHFHMNISSDTVEGIDGPRAPEYDFPSRYQPAKYARGPIVDERVIKYMGEHLADTTAPELKEGQSEFANTLIWGLYDPDDDGIAELTFVEPMITKDYLEHVSGIDTREISQPEAFRRSGNYPTEYTVRDVPSDDAIAITIDSFNYREGDLE